MVSSVRNGFCPSTVFQLSNRVVEGPSGLHGYFSGSFPSRSIHAMFAATARARHQKHNHHLRGVYPKKPHTPCPLGGTEAFHLLKILCFPVGFKGNLSQLDIFLFFPGDLSKWRIRFRPRCIFFRCTSRARMPGMGQGMIPMLSPQQLQQMSPEQPPDVENGAREDRRRSKRGRPSSLFVGSFLFFLVCFFRGCCLWGSFFSRFLKGKTFFVCGVRFLLFFVWCFSQGGDPLQSQPGEGCRFFLRCLLRFPCLEEGGC